MTNEEAEQAAQLEVATLVHEIDRMRRILGLNPRTTSDPEDREESAQEVVFALHQARSTRDWIAGAFAVRWGRWRQEWPISLLEGVQEWGDSHCCRFLLTSEHDADQRDPKEYYLVLYCAPKPNRSSIDEHSVNNRDKNLANFSSWFEGYLAGKGVRRPAGGFFP